MEISTFTGAKDRVRQVVAGEEPVGCKIQGCYQSSEKEGERASHAQEFLHRLQWRSAADGCFCCGEQGHIASYCPAPMPKDLVPQLHLKLGWGGILGKMPPITSNTSPFCGINLHLGHVGHHGGLYVDCGLYSVRCCTLVDTSSTVLLIHCGLLPDADAVHFAEAECRP